MSTDEWKIHRLDLDAYLRRIAYTGSLEPTGRTLTALHRAHIAAIAFENLDVMLGREIGVDLDRVQAKLVGRGRGGYCYEHGTLFAAVLERLGYRVDRLLARVGDDTRRMGPRSHLVLFAGAGDGRWLADVGFGSGLLEPVALAAVGPQRQGEWVFELVSNDDRAWRLRERQGDEWVTLYSFTEETQYAADIETSNYQTSTHHGSPFVQAPVVVRRDDASTRILHGRQFTVTLPDRSARERQVPDSEYGETLRREFGLSLPPQDVTELISTVK